MEAFVAKMLEQWEQGKLSRRKLIETITIAATAVYGGSKAETTVEAAPGATSPESGRGSFHTLLVNHISYSCPDYRKPRDFYTDLMGMELVEKSDNGKQAVLAFGPKGSTPLNSPYGTPVSHIYVRNGKGIQGLAGEVPPTAIVNHIAYTIANWDQKKVLEELTKRGLKPREDTPNSYHVYDPDGYDLQISGIKMSAFGAGG